MRHEATAAQLSFITRICHELEIEEPYCETIWQAKKWIKEHVKEYERAVSDRELYNQMEDDDPYLNDF